MHRDILELAALAADRLNEFEKKQLAVLLIAQTLTPMSQADVAKQIQEYSTNEQN